MRMQQDVITDSAEAGVWSFFHVESEVILAKVGRMTLQLRSTFVYIPRLMH